MNYVPEEWHSSAFTHQIRSYRVSWFKTMLTCTCGATGWNHKQLWREHVRIEFELAEMVAKQQAQRDARWRKRIDAEKAKMASRGKPTNRDSGTLNV